MSEATPAMDAVLAVLRERAKELSCLYRVEELVKDPDRPLWEVFGEVVDALPAGWQYPEVCCARIRHGERALVSAGFRESPWGQHADIAIQGQVVGTLSVFYTEERPPADHGPFLAEEQRLIRTVADRLGHFVLHQELRHAFVRDGAGGDGATEPEWRAALNLLAKTDRRMVEIVERKLLHHLCSLGIPAARELLERVAAPLGAAGGEGAPEDPNAPVSRRGRKLAYTLDDVLTIAAAHMAERDLLGAIHRWIVEDRTSFLLKTLIDERSPISEVVDVMGRYKRLLPEGIALSPAAAKNVVVALVRRLLTDQLDFIGHAKEVLLPEDFFPLVTRIIGAPESRGLLGGKAAGLFLAAGALRRAAAAHPALARVRFPKTYCLPADGILRFITYNNLEDVIDFKYREPEQVRREYDFVVHVFKNSWFPPEVVRGVTLALNELHDGPLVVRSSSLLEDRAGNCFPGKYKSLFLANRGTKRERRDALLDAIAEVYASTFGPDPIEYRAARGLTDFDEQMGVMIQEVVGSPVGPYFLPLCAGVAFGRNDFRWSPRIARADGMVRLVPGLGTRAVDRVGDDYPVLVSPGQPDLRVNTTLRESVAYAPRKIDVIDLDSGRFLTLPLKQFLRAHGHELAGLREMVAVFTGTRWRRRSGCRRPSPRRISWSRSTGCCRRRRFSPSCGWCCRSWSSAWGARWTSSSRGTGGRCTCCSAVRRARRGMRRRRPSRWMCRRRGWCFGRRAMCRMGSWSRCRTSSTSWRRGMRRLGRGRCTARWRARWGR
jgi:pyruvate, water dikinase